LERIIRGFSAFVCQPVPPKLAVTYAALTAQRETLREARADAPPENPNSLE